MFYMYGISNVFWIQLNDSAWISDYCFKEMFTMSPQAAKDGANYEYVCVIVYKDI